MKQLGVEGDSGRLHVNEHIDERHFYVVKKIDLFLLDQLRLKYLFELISRFNVGASVVPGLVHVSEIHGDLVPASADQRCDLFHLDTESIERQLFETEGVLTEKVGSDHRVK